MKIIIISGTPGTGKTSVSKIITELYNAKLISLNELAISENFDVRYDEKRKTYVIDTDKFLPYLIDLIEKYKRKDPSYLIVEGHFSDIIPKRYIDYAIIFRCHPDELYNRLKERNYLNDKIYENLQSEILGNCANYFIQKKINIPIFEIDTTDLTKESVADLIIKNIVENKNAERYLIGNIDWLEKLFQEDRISEFFNKKREI